MFRHFHSIASSSFHRINPWSKHCIGGWFGQILFLSAVFIVFHSKKQSSLIFVSRSIRPLWLQGLYLRTLFLGSKCWMHPRHIHPMGNLGPNWKRGCLLEVFSWTLFLNTIRRTLSPRTSWTYSFILPYLSEMMFADISLDCEVSQRPLCGISSGFRDTFLSCFPIHDGWW